MRRLMSATLWLAALGGTACSSPTAPVPPPTQSSVVSAPVLSGALPGIWRIALAGTRCHNNACSQIPYASLELRIASDAGTSIGLLNIDDLGLYDQIVDLTGTPTVDGLMSFHGSVPRLRDTRDVTEVRALTVRPDAGAGLVGAIDLRQHVPSGGVAWSFVGTIASASHQPLPSTSVLNGRWSGVAIITTCTGDCRANNDAGGERRLELILGGSASAPAGHLQVGLSACSSCWVPVTGTTLTSALSLVAPPYVNPIRPDEVLEVVSWTSSLDVFGRLKGRFTLASKERIAVSPFDVSYRQELEIAWLIRD